MEGCCGGDEALVDCVWRRWEGATTVVWRIFSDWRILDVDIFRLARISSLSSCVGLVPSNTGFSLDITRIQGCSIGSFSLVMYFNAFAGSLCHLFEEIRAYMARIFIRIVQFHPRKLETSPTLCSNQAITYMIAYGLSAAASTRVSNEFGAGNIDQAKSAMAVSLKLTVLLVLIVVSTLAFGHNIWAGFFSDSPEIIKEFAPLTPFLAISITFDFVQGVLSASKFMVQGLARGGGWQHLAVYANLATFYFIGMPIALLLGFKLNLYARGLWIGLICGLFAQTSTLMLITFCRNWTKMDIPTLNRKKEPQVDTQNCIL
ncbi:hypothetical protein QYF36_021607 [Acer negundo]|nr:hypothetical protein QYF36_021607 [Acer negundo]